MRYIRLAIATVLIPVAVWFFAASLPHMGWYHSYCSAQDIKREAQATLPRLTSRNIQTLGTDCADALHRLIAYLIAGIAAALGVFFLLRGRVKGPSTHPAGMWLPAPGRKS